jgi:AraC-like ligand binding domain
MLAFLLLTPNIFPMNSAAHTSNPSHSTDSFEPIERVANRLVGAAFSPHRHDTYTVALTMAGVQAFNYRGAMRHSLPGQVLILHPEEVHDGHCYDEAGFAIGRPMFRQLISRQCLEGRNCRLSLMASRRIPP